MPHGSSGPRSRSSWRTQCPASAAGPVCWGNTGFVPFVVAWGRDGHCTPQRRPPRCFGPVGLAIRRCAAGSVSVLAGGCRCTFNLSSRGSTGCLNRCRTASAARPTDEPAVLMSARLKQPGTRKSRGLRVTDCDHCLYRIRMPECFGCDPCDMVIIPNTIYALICRSCFVQAAESLIWCHWRFASGSWMPCTLRGNLTASRSIPIQVGYRSCCVMTVRNRSKIKGYRFHLDQPHRSLRNYQRHAVL